MNQSVEIQCHKYKGFERCSHGNGKSPFLIGDTSSTGCFSIVMLVFRGLAGGPDP